jgi:tetratricopeptide (TPR) repeat protein
MSKRYFSLLAIPCVVFLTFVSPASTQGNEEAQGQFAEQAGRLREAITHYIAALQSTIEGSDGERRLREKVIKLVLKLDPPPTVPTEAIRYEGRAEAAVKNARTSTDYTEAANEYRKALQLAPWVAHYYFNLGIILEKAGHAYSGAS